MANKARGIREIEPGRYEINYQVNGRRKQYQVSAKSLKEVRAIREEHKVELRKSLSLPQHQRYDASFEEAWEKLYADLLSDKRSHKNILRHKKTFWRLFGDFRERRFPNVKSVSQFSESFLKEYKSYYINELNRNPQGGWRSELICIKSMMRRFKGLGYCSKEVIDGLEAIKRPKPVKRSYPDICNSRIKELLGFMRHDRPDYFNVVYFICRTGRRIEETTLIEARDVGFAGLRPIRLNIRAETTKTKEAAPLEMLDNDLAKVIKAAYQLSLRLKSKFLFCNNRGKKCSQNRVREYLKKASRDIAGIEVTPHYFRHRFLTECGKAGVPIVDIMAISGITHIKTILNYYTHITKEGQLKVLAVSRIG